MLPDRSGRQAGSARRTPPRPRRASPPGRRRRPRRRRAAATPRAAGRRTPSRARRRAPPAPSGSNCRSASSGPADQLAEPEEELRLERADGQLAPVGGRVDPVAGEAAGQEARERIAAEPVRDEPVRAVRHRDRQPGAAARALALEQRGEHLGDRAERAGGEIGGLERRQAGRRVLEHARPAEVVEVVTGARRVRPVGAEAGDRAVDGRLAARRPGRRRAGPRRRAGSPRARRPRAPAGRGASSGRSSGRRRPTPCPRSAPRPTRARRAASGRPRAARAGRRARRAAAARVRRTRPAGSGSGRRRACRPAVAPAAEPTTTVRAR